MSIKLINRNTDYAVQALCYMARREHKHKPHVTSVSELVEELKVPRAFIRKIMQILNNESVLLSKRGWGGGFRLAREPKKISLLEVVKVFQGPIKLSECVLQKEACPNKKPGQATAVGSPGLRDKPHPPGRLQSAREQSEHEAVSC